MNLRDAKPESVYHVECLLLDIGTKRRLEALGMTYGTSITVLNRKKNGTLIFKVRGTRFAIGCSIAEGIILQEGANS